MEEEFAEVILIKIVFKGYQYYGILVSDKDS